MVRFLVVDDDPTLRSTMRILLRRIAPNVGVDEVDNAHDAVDAYEKIRPDVVFLDMELAGGPGGLYTAGLIRGKDPHARLVLVTSLPADDPKVKAAMARGANTHLQKPPRLDAIQKALAGVKLD